MNGRDYIAVIIGVLALCALVYHCQPEPDRHGRVEVVTDTVYEVVERPPIVLAGRATRIVRRDTIHDTSFVPVSQPCAPYTATLDTIVSRDTIQITYEHPRAHFTLLLRQRPDSIMTIHTLQTNVRHEAPSMWASFGSHVAALLVGYAIGRTQ